jgi:hypothetical protein
MGKLSKLEHLLINQNKIRMLNTELHWLLNLKKVGLDWFYYAVPTIPQVLDLTEYFQVGVEEDASTQRHRTQNKNNQINLLR